MTKNYAENDREILQDILDHLTGERTQDLIKLKINKTLPGEVMFHTLASFPNTVEVYEISITLANVDYEKKETADGKVLFIKK